MADKRANVEPDFLRDVSGAPNGHGAEPPMPVLKGDEKKKEKRGGAAPLVAGGPGQSGGGWFFRLFGFGGRSGLSVGRAALGSRAVMGAAGSGVRLGLVPTLLNFLSSNAGLATLAVALSAGAVWSLYKLGMKAMEDGQVSSREHLFARPDGDSMSASAGAEGRTDASGLSFFSAANKGAMGAEGVKNEEAAEAKDAAKAEGEGAKSGEGAKEGEGAGDPGSKLATAFNAAGKPKMMGAQGFGSSRGIGGLAGGMGMSGGVGRGFLPTATKKDKATPMRSNMRASNLASRKLTPTRTSAALNQARFANKQSQAAKGMKATEAQSYGATQAFEGGNDMLGNPISGAGAGASPGAGAGTGGATPYEGPIYNDPGMSPPPSTGKSGNKSPWQKMLMMGVALLFAASTIILIEGILAQLGKIILPLEGIALMLMGVAAALAAAAAAIGAMIAGQYGPMQQGMILTVGGGITSAAAIAAMVAPPEVMPIVSVLGGIAGIAASIGSLLMMNKAPNQNKVPNQK